MNQKVKKWEGKSLGYIKVILIMPKIFNWGNLNKWNHPDNIMLMGLCAETWLSPMVHRSIVVKKC